MVSLVAVAANTPIGAGTGASIPPRLLAVRKSGSLEVELGREIEDVKATAPVSPVAALGKISRSTTVFGRRRHHDDSGEE